MLVEHMFVTTLPSEQAMMRAMQVLVRLRFSFLKWDSSELHATRGRVWPIWGTLAKRPQSVRVHYDRGRVTLAASIVSKDLAVSPECGQFLTTLASTLEQAMTGTHMVDQCAASVQAVDANATSPVAEWHKFILWSLAAFAGVALIVVIAMALKHK
jgi:hypothetical protein